MLDQGRDQQIRPQTSSQEVTTGWEVEKVTDWEAVMGEEAEAATLG